MFYAFCRLLCIIFFKFTLRVEVRGKENVPAKGGFILACNHVSYLDPVAVGIVCQRQLNYMAKAELFTNPFFARILSGVGAFAVKRNSADFSALREAIRRVKSGKALLLFPEGSRNSMDASIVPQSGVGFLAAKLKVPVVPVLIQGTQNALPRGSKFIKPTKITITFGKQILIEGRMPYQDTARLIMRQIRHLAC